eukprot:SAG11_NODE_2622_length_3167_cov_3.968057_2_plen_253_part_00
MKYALEEWREKLRGKHVLLWEDNQAVVGTLRRLVTKSPGMMEDLGDIIDILEAENIVLQVRYLKSERNPSDWYSRVRDASEWRLRPAVADALMHRWGPAQVDRFADSALTQLPRFNAAYPCRGAETVDCFTVSWEGTHSWVNAPWNKVGRVLHKLWLEPAASAAMLVPWWESADWWPLLRRLASDSMEVRLQTNDVVRGPLMLPDVTPEPLGNSGWRLLLVLVPARTAPQWSQYSDAMTIGAVRGEPSPGSF